MKKIISKIAGVLLIALLAIAPLSASVTAHAVTSAEPSPGIVQFLFDDGDAMSGAFISVRDVAGTEIGSGTTDSNGFFDFSAYA